METSAYRGESRNLQRKKLSLTDLTFSLTKEVEKRTEEFFFEAKAID